MRVIGGRHKGRKLKKFRGSDIRPTSDRLRESIFNILGHRVQGKRVLDLFAGTGAMGIEALSREAEFAVFIDVHPGAVALIRQNLTTCGLEDRARVVKWNAGRNLNCLKQHRQYFDLVFMDPPYGAQLVAPALVSLKQSDAIADGARIVVEHAASEPLARQLPGLAVLDQRQYGKTLVSILSLVV